MCDLIYVNFPLHMIFVITLHPLIRHDHICTYEYMKIILLTFDFQKSKPPESSLDSHSKKTKKKKVSVYLFNDFP